MPQASMPNKDLISKKILKRLLVEFSTQLFGLNIVDAEPLDTEQPRIEGKRADLVARVKDGEGKSYILHVEIQNDNQAHFPIRMLRYYTDLALTYPGEDIKQYLLYMGKADLRPLQKGIFLPPALFANAHLLFHKLRFAA